jgi:chromosome segregation ATPase
MEHQDKNHTKKAIDELQARRDHFTRLLIKEKQRTSTLQVKLDEVNEKIANLRDSNKQKAVSLLNKYTTTPNDAYIRVDGVNPAMLAEENQKKIVKKLESRLGKTLIRRSEVENENDAIKGKIDKLRRKIYIDSNNKECMKEELMKVKDDVDEIMTRAAAVAAERERLIERRNQVLQQDHEQQIIFEKEYNELCLFIAKQAKSLEESIAKAADSVTSQLSTVEGGQGLNSKSVSDSMDDIKHLEDRVAALDIEYEATQSSLRENQWKIHHFEEKFKELREVSGLSSTDNIISTFVKNEDECFSIFNYIQAVNHDCGRTTKQTAKLREEINQYKHKQMEDESTRSATMNIYKESLHEVKLEREKLCEIAIEGRRTIESIAHRVTALFFKFKCHELKGDELTTKYSVPPQLYTDRKLTTIGGGEVSERNILNLMELIETRSIQIVEAFQNQMAASKRSRRPSVILVRHACLFRLW